MKSLKNLLSLALSLIMAVVLFSCSDDDSADVTPVEEQSIVEIAAADAQFSTLVSALQRVNLVATLEGNGPFTVFAPTNEAFTALGVNLDDLTDEQLTNILLYHVLADEVPSTALPEGQTYASTASASGPARAALSVLVEKTNGGVKLNNASNVISADINASNGVIHVIDAVILPLDIVGHAAANTNFSSLVGALGAADGDLVSVLQGSGPFTVFAPLNSAFAAISDVVATLSSAQLAGVLTYHVAAGNVRSTDLSSGQVVPTVNGQDFTVNIGTGVTLTDANANISNVVLTDVQCTNGVIHVLDKVILPN